MNQEIERTGTNEKIIEAKVIDTEASINITRPDKQYLNLMVPGTGMIVKEAAYRLCSNHKYMVRTFMAKGMGLKELQDQYAAVLGYHLHEQCVVKEVPYDIFRDGCIFYNQITPHYHSRWAIIVMRMRAEKQQLDKLADFNVKYIIPGLKELIANQAKYAEDYNKNPEKYNRIVVNSIEIEPGTDIDFSNRSYLFYPRGQVIITGAMVKYNVVSYGTQTKTPGGPTYFFVDHYKTKCSHRPNPTCLADYTPYGLYQEKTVRTKAIRQAMQDFYDYTILDIHTVDEDDESPDRVLIDGEQDKKDRYNAISIPKAVD